MGIFGKKNAEEEASETNKGSEEKIFKFNLGDLVRDKVTGFEGVVILRCDFLTGCNVYATERYAPESGGVANLDVTEDRLELVTANHVAMDRPIDFEYTHGKKLRDTVTGFTGTVTTRLQQSSGDNRYSIERISSTSGVLKSTFDECRLEPVDDDDGGKEKLVRDGKPRGGGPIPRMTVR